MRGLYAIADLSTLDARGLDPVAFCHAVIDGGATSLQLRAKRDDAGRVLGLLRAIRPIATEHRVALFANDRPDLAILARCDGVHVGQTDLAPADVRELAVSAGASLSIGLSTHDEQQADRAAAEPVDYIAIGPVRGTSTKENPDPVLGIGRARSMAGRIKARRDVAVVAIGGIDSAAATELRGAVDAIAVVGALMPPPGEPVAAATARARAILEAFGP
jgi:thiamine-phosphate pyrophosphorylase